MSAHDVSRHLFNPGNHYAGLRMQQGRVVLDSDINEARMIDDEEQRILVVDVVGPHGSPDSGFEIANVSTTAPYDFDIQAGTYYLGGYRHEIAGAGPLDPQTFRAQTNWLQSSRNDEAPALPTVPIAPRHDFVYLVGWEQGVSVVEDSELREQAIVGHDTGYRIRRMHRVYAHETSSASCKEAFALFITELCAGVHTFDLANYELRSSARMTVLADPITTADDLCTPPVLQGFSGAENQALRVQLIQPDRFLWSLDNASPLHRLTVTVDGDIATLTLLTAPRDHAHIPVRSLQIEAVGQFGVMILGGLDGAAFVYCREISLQNLDIRTRRDPALAPPMISALWVTPGSSAFPLSTVAVYLTERLTITGCKLTMTGTLSSAANIIFNQVSYGLVRDCKILTPSPPAKVRSWAWGGVQLIWGSDVTLEGNEIVSGLGHGVTLGSISYSEVTVFGYTSHFDTTGRLVIADDEDCPGVGGDLPLTALLPGSDEEVEVHCSPAPSKLRIVGNRIRGMGGSGIAVIGFGPDTAVDPYDHTWMVEATDLVVADNVIEDNYQHPATKPVPDAMSHMVAFGGIVLGVADGLRIHDNRIKRNGGDHRDPVCGIFVYHGEDIAVENNLIDDNGPRVEGTGLAGIRAGIALQFVGRRVSATAEDYAVDPDNLMPAARVRGNVVHQPAGRALQIYGLGAIFVQGNSLVSEGLADLETPPLAHCIEIQNLGQSPEIGLEGVIPANLGYLPAPPLPQAPLPVAEDLLDGRILFTDNQVHFKPVASAAVDIRWSVRLQSYGDVAVLDNQFLVTFPTEGGSLNTDTSIIAWSTRTNNNRWEDPIVVTDGVYQTDVSASTLARMNVTALNQASRCIHVTISPNIPEIDDNPIDDNQTYTTCDETGFAALLAPAP
jgi:hypothetical protein